LAFFGAGRARDGALNVIFGHVDTLGHIQSHAQTRVGFNVRTAIFYRDSNEADHFRERRTAFLVGNIFIVSNSFRVRMSGHGNKIQFPVWAGFLRAEREIKRLDLLY